MKKIIQAVAKTYKAVKESFQERWGNFTKKFETTKVEILHDVMNAKTPEELIVLGKKLQDEGKALEIEEEEIREEELVEKAHEDELKAAEAEKLRIAEEVRIKAQEAEKIRIAEEEKIKAIEAERVRVEAEKIKLAEAERLRLKEEERIELAKLAEIRAKMNAKEEETVAVSENDKSKAENIVAEVANIEQVKLTDSENRVNNSQESKKDDHQDEKNLNYRRIESNALNNKNLITPEGADEKEPEKVTENKIENIKKVNEDKSNHEIKTESPDNQNRVASTLTPDEVKIAAKKIAKSDDGTEMLMYLASYKNDRDIIAQPEIISAFKKNLAEGMYFYDIDRLANIPGISKEIFDDPAAQKGIQSSLRSFVSNLSSSEWRSDAMAIDRVIAEAKISDVGLRNVAEEIKRNPEAYRLFVEHFGEKRLYPELNQ